MLGAIGGPLVGVFAPKGKFRKQVMGFYYLILVVSAGLFAGGVISFISGQPYAVWYGLGFPGFLCLIIFGGLLGIVSKWYNEVELRKTMADDI